MPNTLRDYYQDPGHGWIEVPLVDLKELEIAELISPYSYVHGDYAYLEEDCDGPIYLKEMEKHGCDVELREVYQEYTAIRDYRSYQPWMVIPS